MTDIPIAETRPDRRSVLRGAGAVAALALVGVPFSRAEADDAVAAAVREAIGARVPVEGGIELTLPAIAENGAMVPLTVSVPGGARAIHLFATANPTPGVATYRLGPAVARAEVQTRIRLARDQVVVALAETADGRVLRATAQARVTVGGCVG
jgi:sulfur-oxidizing protein SoxY